MRVTYTYIHMKLSWYVFIYVHEFKHAYMMERTHVRSLVHTARTYARSRISARTYTRTHVCLIICFATSQV